MKTVFIGSSRFGLRCLRALTQQAEIEVLGVITAPRKFSISYRPQGVENVLHEDFQEYCENSNIPVVELERGMKDKHLLEAIQKWNPQCFIVAGWYHMIPRTYRELAPAYGLHASLLPDYSGGAPLVWAIINGEKQTGITFFQMDDGVDSGPIIGQTSCEITESDNIASLYKKIEELGLELLVSGAKNLSMGTAEHVMQDEARRRIFPQRGPEDGEIDWSWSAKQVFDFVRAQTRPYPGAFYRDAQTVKTIWACRVSNAAHSLEPGQRLEVDGSVFIGCGDESCVEILEEETRNPITT